MFRSFRIGRILGFPVELNLSFLLMLVAATLWLGGLTGLIFILVAFGSVLLHELGHAVVARYLGIPIAGIELHFFGGAAKLAGQPKTPSDEIAIAAAGPAVSFALGGIGMVLAAITGWSALATLGWLNLVIGAFNLIPALPMDGGRILRAALTPKLGYLRATETSVTVARILAIGAGVFAVASGHLYLAVLAVVVWLMGTAERNHARTTFSGSQAHFEVLPHDPFDKPHRWPTGQRHDRSASGFIVTRRGGHVTVEFVEE